LRPESVVGHIVNTVDGDDVETVIVGGNIVMRNRKVLTMEECEVTKISRRAAEKLWMKLGAIRR
jgi:cytosine/adenosine deaminase-related metal-dependent hydrolase